MLFDVGCTNVDKSAYADAEAGLQMKKDSKLLGKSLLFIISIIERMYNTL